MGLKDILSTQGSPLSIANGGNVSTNPLAASTSKLHADGNQPGYSLNGANGQFVNNQYQQYVDGVGNILPQPSQLDLDGQTPSKYSDNLPQ